MRPCRQMGGCNLVAKSEGRDSAGAASCRLLGATHGCVRCNFGLRKSQRKSIANCAEDTFELPAVTANLAKRFAKAPEFGENQRQKYAALAQAMEQAVPYGKANGRYAEANGESDSVLPL